MKYIRVFVLSCFLFGVSCSPAYALGDKEKGALIGIGSVLLYQHITNPRVDIHKPPQVHYIHKYPSRTYQSYSGRYADCVHHTQMFPIKDNYGNIIGWRQC